MKKYNLENILMFRKQFVLTLILLVVAGQVNAQKTERIEIQELNKVRKSRSCSCEADKSPSSLCQNLCDTASKFESIEDYENHLLENNIPFKRIVFNEKSPIYYVKSNNVQLDDLVYNKLKKKWVAENPEEYEKLTNGNKIMRK